MSVTLFNPQVTRIPVQGPAPFNTLVVVAGEAEISMSQIVEFGKEAQQTGTFVSTFVNRAVLANQNQGPVFQHSTTAWIHSIGPADNPGPLAEIGGHFLYSVDKVAGAGFNPVDGTYFVVVDLSVLVPPPPSDALQCAPFLLELLCAGPWSVQITSFVLVNEPPAPAAGRHAARRIPRGAFLGATGSKPPVANFGGFVPQSLFRQPAPKVAGGSETKCSCGAQPKE
jgi:hypothetical protein